MKKTRLVLSLAAITVLAACGSSSSKPPSPVGIWWGNVTVPSTPPTLTPFALGLLADGTTRGYTTSAGQGVTGTWTANGAQVTAVFTFDSSGPPAWTFTGNIASGVLSGTGTNGTSTVTFSLPQTLDLGSGIWKGKYGMGAGATLTNDYLVLLFPGAISEIHDGATLAATTAVGTWSMSGSAPTIDFTYTGGGPTYRIVGNIAGDALTGTWGAPPAGTSGGPLSLGRQR